MDNSKQGIKHIEIAVSDLQKSLDFYRPLFEMIGWEEVDKNGFVSGNLKIYLKMYFDDHENDVLRNNVD